MAIVACSRNSGVPRAGSKQYRDFVSAFYVGLAGLQTGEDGRAKEKLTLASEIAPGEPATWANLALFAGRQQDFDRAYEYAGKARALAPDDGRIEVLLGSIEEKRGKLSEAIGHFKKATELDPKDVKALYALAEATERQPGGEAEKLYQRVLALRPDNLAVLLDVTRAAAKGGDATVVRDAAARLAAASAGWPPEARQRAVELKKTAEAAPQAAGIQAAFLRNVLLRVPDYRRGLNEVKTPAIFVGEPFLRPLRMEAPSSEPAPLDAALHFEAQPMKGAPDSCFWAGSLLLDDSGKYTSVWVDAKGLNVAGGAKLPLPGAAKQMSRDGIAAADLNYDFKMDLVYAGPGGVRMFQQKARGNFEDVTPAARIPATILNAAYTGVWAFDVDLDGDLDLVLGTASGEPVVLRNNGDGTFAVLRPFHGIDGLVSFAAADIDGDGDPDVAMVDGKGGLLVFSNERLGEYKSKPALANEGSGFVAVSAGDLNGDGMPDFAALRRDGSVARVSQSGSEEVIPPQGMQAEANLLLGDFDNNGALDVLAGRRLFLSDGRKLQRAGGEFQIAATGAADAGGSGHLGVFGTANGKPVELVSRGGKDYKWQNIRVRAAKATGDQRINSFGIGGEVEIRAGLLTQKQIIASPVLHFGLGEQSDVQVARIVWPNGSIQAEFELKADQTIPATQRLKGSCPSLFAWNGKRMAFVKDGSPWSPALGLHINAQTVAGISQTEEWFKIPGEAMEPRDGAYDVRITAELWETFYIDHYELMAVDHPAGTEIYTDERFSVPPPALTIFAVGKTQPFATAMDDRGEDVSGVVRENDRKYLDTFGRGAYQGVTRDHWVELQLPDSAPRTGSLYLIGQGWMHPTDATVNIALGQNSAPAPEGLRIETPDAKGRWMVALPSLGFPAGKLKTVVFDISKAFRAGAPRKLRLRTNMEIYWDRLAWAAGAADTNVRVERLPMKSAELRYRGFSAMQAANESSPELPDYERIEGTAQKWRDLEGYYTRYGDIRELLARVDDRIAIVNAGDEMRLRFGAGAPARAGWVRDFVMIGDGWIKDGDYNSVFSKTVLPLPYHGMKDYTRAPGALENDPAYRRNPADWEKFHTRYITPEWFIGALRN